MRVLLALLLTVGVLVILLHGDLTTLKNIEFNRGDLIIVVAVASAAVGGYRMGFLARVTDRYGGPGFFMPGWASSDLCKREAAAPSEDGTGREGLDRQVDPEAEHDHGRHEGNRSTDPAEAGSGR